MRQLRFILIPLVVLVLAVVAVVAYLTANVDHYRPRIQAELQTKLNRPVTIGHLGLRLFPLSIRADDVTIGDAPEFGAGKPFASAKDLFVSAGLFSLISGNPEVKDLSLEQPQIELIRNAAGVWNFSTLGGSSSSGSSSGQLTLNEFKIDDGQVAVTDKSASEPRSVYDHIDLKVTDFAPHKQFGVDLAAHFPGTGKELLSFKGDVGPLEAGNTASTSVKGHVSLQEISLSGVNRVSAGALPEGTDGVASGDADINSQAETLSAKGDLKVANAVIHGSKLDFPISAKYDLTDDRKGNTIQVRSGSLDLGSTSFTLSGSVDEGKKPANLNVRLGTNNSSITELAKLAGAFGVAFNPAYQVKGFVTADVTATGAATAPQLNGTLKARQVEVSGGEIKQPVSVPEIDLALSPDTIRSNNFTAQSGSTALGVVFALSQYASTNKSVDATLKTDGANIAELLNMAKAYGMDASKGMSATGKLSLNVHVQGPLADSSKLAYAGTANLSGATVTSPQLTKPLSVSSANAQFSQNSVAISGLAAAIGSTSVHGSMSAKNFAAPEIQFALAADKIDTAEIENLTASPSAQNKQEKSGTAANKPSLLETVTGSGTLAANTVKAESFVLTNVKTTCKLNRGVISLTPLSANLFGGSEIGNLTLDMRPVRPLCAVNAKFNGVDTNALLSATSSMTNTLYGSLAADTNLRFVLGPSAQLAQTLNGTVGFNVTNGQLKNVNILNEISKVGKFLNPGPAQASGSATNLKKLSGTMNIVNGVATTNNLTAALDAGSLAANGSLNLASQAVDMHMSAVLGSGTSQTVGGTHVGGFLNTALANNKGELVIPVLVTGTTSHLVFTPDAAAMAKMKLNNLLPTVSDPSKLASQVLGGKGAGGIVNGLLGGQAAPAQNGQAQPAQNQTPQNAINSILGGFGKKKKQPQPQ